MDRKLFGTDGIRGVAGVPPLDRRTVYATGIALGKWAAATHGPGSEVLIGMDTRESGPWIAECVASGVIQAGARVRFAGLITTPGVAYLTRSQDFVAGVMISASHNPYQDNGIKIFDHSGFKFPDDREHALEQVIFSLLEAELSIPPVSLHVEGALDRAYADFLGSTFSHDLKGWKIVLDCANGAAARLAPELFRHFGAEIVAIGCVPDGCNINLNCGALHLDNLRRKVLETGATVGIAFDGDADRTMLVSSSGRVIDGDAVLLVCAQRLLAQGRLNDKDGNPTVVSTVMSNFGLERALKNCGVRLLRASVGDKYVLEEMIRTGSPLGGEQSGHVIFRQYATTGDGMLTAIRVLDVMCETGKNLDDLTVDLQIFPQILVNVRIRERRSLDDIPAVQDEISAAIAAFDGAGRVLVRFSGTEPLARVMVEGPDKDRVELYAQRIADVVQKELGG